MKNAENKGAIAREVRNSGAVLDKNIAAVADAMEAFTASDTVHVSWTNSKLGRLPSISFPAGVTCPREASCRRICYALRGNFARASVAAGAAKNLAIYHQDPAAYWADVVDLMRTARALRLNASGDFPRREFVAELVAAAQQEPACDVLVYTKRWVWVNDYLAAGGEIPANLRLIFSRAPGMEIPNPFDLPVAEIISPAMESSGEIPGEWMQCPAQIGKGDCATCHARRIGCWALERGQTVGFYQH